MAPITDRAVLARVTKLHGQALIALERCHERESQLADLRERQAQLQHRLVNDQAARPEDHTSEELADVLIADPEADLSTSARTSLRTARDKSARVIADHEALTSVTATAIAKIEDRIRETETELASVKTTAAEAWHEFVVGAYDAVLDEVRQQVQQLNDGPLGLLVSLADQHELDRAQRVISGSFPRLTDESRVILRTFGVPITEEKLFAPNAVPGQHGWIDRRSVLERFRASLCAAQLTDAL